MKVKQEHPQFTVSRALVEWLIANAPERIEARTKAILDEALEHIILEIAGIRRDNWGTRRWEIDHTNARSTVLSERVKETVRPAVIQWIADNITQLPVMSAEMKKAYVDEYKERFERELRKEIWIAAQRAAAEQAQEIVNQMSEEIIGHWVATRSAFDYTEFEELFEQEEKREDWVDE